MTIIGQLQGTPYELYKPNKLNRLNRLNRLNKLANYINPGIFNPPVMAPMRF